MALINCPECGQSISDTAETCPSCGYKLHSAKPKIKKLLLAIVIFIVIIIGVLLIFNKVTQPKNPFDVFNKGMTREEIHKLLGTPSSEQNDSILGGELLINSEIYEFTLEKTKGDFFVFYTDDDILDFVSWSYTFSSNDPAKCEKKANQILSSLIELYGEPTVDTNSIGENVAKIYDDKGREYRITISTDWATNNLSMKLIIDFQ